MYPKTVAGLVVVVIVAAACASGSPSGAGGRGGSTLRQGGSPTSANTSRSTAASPVSRGTGTTLGTMSAMSSVTDGGSATGDAYDALVLGDQPVAYWAMNRPTTATEPDLTGNGNRGSYTDTSDAGVPPLVPLPNGDEAADFNGSSQYLTVASNPSLSIPTTGELTWEGWIRPDTLQFARDSGSGYVDWMGKCAAYSPTCEWEARMYSTNNAQGRCNRLSAYVFNLTAGLGSAADWQPTCGLFQANVWYHVVGEYTTKAQPATCTDTPAYPGSINIWVNGVPWSQPNHDPTGCMSQYDITPQAAASPLNIGTMAYDTWFPGAVGKVAIYDYLLSQAQIDSHYVQMTGQSPSGTCSDSCTIPIP